jgi:hypothetical protein
MRLCHPYQGYTLDSLGALSHCRSLPADVLPPSFTNLPFQKASEKQSSLKNIIWLSLHGKQYNRCVTLVTNPLISHECGPNCDDDKRNISVVTCETDTL